MAISYIHQPQQTAVCLLSQYRQRISRKRNKQVKHQEYNSNNLINLFVKDLHRNDKENYVHIWDGLNLSYRIFDDIIDDCRNFSDSNTLYLFSLFLNSLHNTQKYIHKIGVDAAGYQYISESILIMHKHIFSEKIRRVSPISFIHPRLYSSIYLKSAPIIGCIVSAIICGSTRETLDHSFLKHIKIFLRYFIQIRQLSDDALDWNEDMKSGVSTDFMSNFINKKQIEISALSKKIEKLYSEMIIFISHKAERRLSLLEKHLDQETHQSLLTLLLRYSLPKQKDI